MSEHFSFLGFATMYMYERRKPLFSKGLTSYGEKA